MTFVQIISSVLALLQFVGISLNVVPFEKKVNYGGTPTVETVVTEWLKLIENNNSDYVIVHGSSASASEVTAATELQSYLAQISGETLQIFTDDRAPQPKEIIVGKTKREDAKSYTIDRAALGDDGFRLLVVGEKLVIAGGELRGTLYGVYTFLEEQLGCRWFTSDLNVIPDLKTVQINAKLDDTQKPAFAARNCGSGTAAWNAKQKGNVFISSEAYGGGYNHITWDVSMDKFVPDSLFALHPKYFTYREDTKLNTIAHVCLSNPEVLQVALQNAETLIQNAAPGQTILHIGQKDNQDYCQCPTCKALYEKYGSLSATIVLFTNALSNALAKDHSNITYTFFAYLDTEVPPVGLKCNANVTPVFCPINLCYAHPITECGNEDGSQNETFDYRFSKHEPRYAEYLKGWGDSSEKIYVYNYTVNFLNYLQFAANLQTLAPDFQFYSQNKVTGIYYNCGGGHSTAAFNDLRNYLIAKVMWNPNCDVEHCMDEFMAAYYGDAAPFIKEYINYVTAKVIATTHDFIMEWHYQTAVMTNKEVRTLDSLWDKAEAANLTDNQRFRVETGRLSFQYYKANLFRGEFNILNPFRGVLNEKLYDDLKTHGITMICGFTPMPAKEDINFFTSNPVDWR